MDDPKRLFLILVILVPLILLLLAYKRFSGGIDIEELPRQQQPSGVNDAAREYI